MRKVPSKFNRDTLNMADPADIQRAAVTAADKMQDFLPEIQTAGLAAMFLFMCERWGTPPQDIFAAVSKTFYRGDGSMRHEFKALKAYLANDVFQAA